jgi:hypothetical protein
MKSTPEGKAALEADENERTTETGLFHYAVSYHGVADYVGKAESLRVTHPDAPREFLYVHAIELYLKAYLRNCGMTVQELRSIGHRFLDLGAKFEQRGGFLMDEDKSVLTLIDANSTNIESRYIVAGYFHKASMEALVRTCISLRQTVGEALRASGRIVR